MVISMHFIGISIFVQLDSFFNNDTAKSGDSS